MTEQVDVAEQQEVDVNEIQALKAQLEEAKKAIEALAHKKDELLKETKQAKEEKRKAAEIVEAAKQKELESAQKNGEFERLWKQAQEEKEQLAKELMTDRQQRRDEKIRIAATKLALDLAKGDVTKAELLTEFVAKSVSNVADDAAHIDNDVLLSIKNQFEKDAKFAPLLAGNQAAGGSAPGNTRSAQQDTKTMERAAFDKLDPAKRMEFVKKGGTLI
jgi:uncharacterized protein (DUF3084 family)